jgi:cardiolipin synthase
MNAVVLRPRHHLQLFQGADALFAAMVHAIEHSQLEVRLESYIFSFDQQGQAVASALERAALRGVQVYFGGRWHRDCAAATPMDGAF